MIPSQSAWMVSIGVRANQSLIGSVAGSRSGRDGAVRQDWNGTPSAAASAALQASLSASTACPCFAKPLAANSIGCTWPPPSQVAKRNFDMIAGYADASADATRTDGALT